MLDAEIVFGVTPDPQPMGYRGSYTNLTGRMVNFFNPQDSVLGIWVIDQRLAKPDQSPLARYYSYDGTNSYNIVDPGFPLLVTDPHESRAMVARSRTWSIGVQAPASGQSSQGVIGSAVDLNTQFGFFNITSEHSAQWTRPIQTCRPYFQQVLTSCLIQPAP